MRLMYWVWARRGGRQVRDLWLAILATLALAALLAGHWWQAVQREWVG